MFSERSSLFFYCCTVLKNRGFSTAAHNERREINRMCKEISRFLRHESFEVLGQQLQVILVEENIGGGERRRYVGIHNFIYFVSYYTKHKL